MTFAIPLGLVYGIRFLIYVWFHGRIFVDVRYLLMLRGIVKCPRNLFVEKMFKRRMYGGVSIKTGRSRYVK